MMLDILGEFMLFHGIQYERLDGSTTVVDRQKIIDSFNAKDSKIYVFLLSTRAGKFFFFFFKKNLGSQAWAKAPQNA
jgi:SNF2 family DNA or RNA helicase